MDPSTDLAAKHHKRAFLRGLVNLATSASGILMVSLLADSAPKYTRSYRTAVRVAKRAPMQGCQGFRGSGPAHDGISRPAQQVIPMLGTRIYVWLLNCLDQLSLAAGRSDDFERRNGRRCQHDVGTRNKDSHRAVWLPRPDLDDEQHLDDQAGRKSLMMQNVVDPKVSPGQLIARAFSASGKPRFMSMSGIDSAPMFSTRTVKATRSPILALVALEVSVTVAAGASCAEARLTTGAQRLSARR